MQEVVLLVLLACIVMVFWSSMDQNMLSMKSVSQNHFAHAPVGCTTQLSAGKHVSCADLRLSRCCAAR